MVCYFEALYTLQQFPCWSSHSTKCPQVNRHCLTMSVAYMV